MARCRCFLQDASLARGPASPKRRPCPDTASFALGRSLWLPSVGIQRRAVHLATFCTGMPPLELSEVDNNTGERKSSRPIASFSKGTQGKVATLPETGF